MKYERSNRVQRDTFESTIELLQDVIEVLQCDEKYEMANIVTDYSSTVHIVETMLNNNFGEFEFDVHDEFYRDKSEPYVTSIVEDGAVFVAPVYCKGDQIMNLEGFIYADKYMDESIYHDVNRRCDTLVYSLNE